MHYYRPTKSSSFWEHHFSFSFDSAFCCSSRTFQVWS